MQVKQIKKLIVSFQNSNIVEVWALENCTVKMVGIHAIYALKGKQASEVSSISREQWNRQSG